MATHDQKQQARRYIERAEKLQEHCWPGLIVAVSLVVGGLYDETVGLAGLVAFIGIIVVAGVAELYLRAARRLLNQNYRRR